VSFDERSFHFAGVGGAGMSALATVAYAWGSDVSGCDRARSPYLERLVRFGIPVALEHDPAHVSAGVELVVTSALPGDHPEVRAARDRRVRVLHRAELLGEIVASRRSICVAGAHGKTTTAAMIAFAARELGLDPTYLVGGEVPQLGGNAGPGGGELLVAEADESDGSIALLVPAIAVITNVEVDHHARFASLAELRELFDRWAAGAREAVLAREDVPLAREEGVQRFGHGEDADWQISGVELERAQTGFWLRGPSGTPAHVTVSVPGAHNAQNAAAAVAALALAGVDPGDAAEALAGFRGTSRRFELRGERDGVRVVDDYAHNPTKVAAAIATARTQGARRVLVCFQPHLYSRTAALALRFGGELAKADEVVVTEIYAAREAPLEGVTAKLVVDAVSEARPGMRLAYEPTLVDAAAYLRGRTRAGDLVLTVGAGDVREVGDLLLAR
jgi:UDP-N-acetylmuramate--alanine ligase